jgi:hypothetical protein
MIAGQAAIVNSNEYFVFACIERIEVNKYLPGNGSVNYLAVMVITLS